MKTKALISRMLTFTMLFGGGSAALASGNSKDAASNPIESLNQNLGTPENPFSLNVPGEPTTGDNGTIDPPYAAKYIQETCDKFSDKKIRKEIRVRMLSMLKQMEMGAIRNETDHDPSAEERKKIVSERKRIRSELTDILKKHCS